MNPKLRVLGYLFITDPSSLLKCSSCLEVFGGPNVCVYAGEVTMNFSCDKWVYYYMPIAHRIITSERKFFRTFELEKK